MELISRLPISKTKIIVPTRRLEILTRPRLIEALHDLLDKKLILITAPAGYGKTSLLIDLADKGEIPVCWLSLDALDRELQRFVAYFIASIRQVFQDFGKESLAALDSLTFFEKDGERILVTITNEIREEIHEHFAVVLDDYHLIDQVPEIRTFINRFLQLASENVHLILASRTLPALQDLHLMIARDLVAGISFEELAFHPREIQEFFLQNSNGHVTQEYAEKLARETEGWITAIYLASFSLLRSPLSRPIPSPARETELSEYFSREVLEKQGIDLQEFLLLTSPFDEFDVDLCTAVLDPVLSDKKRDWKNLFRSTQRNNLFAIPLGPDGKWIRYHHLFKDFLQMRLQAGFPELASRVYYQLARVYEQQNKWEEAHYIYEQLGDQDGLALLIENAGSHLIRGGRIVTLGNWLERLPVSILQGYPQLLSLQGTVYYTQGDIQMGISLLSQAEVSFKQSGDANNLALTLTRRAVAYRYLGEYSLSLADADEAILLTQENPNNTVRGTFAEALRVKGLALFQLGRAGEAVTWLEKSLHIFTIINEAGSIPILQMEMGMVYRSLGDHRAATSYYNKALITWEQTGNVGWRALLLNNLGVLYHLSGKYDEAFRTLEESLNSAERSGYIRTKALALDSLGDLLSDVQDYGQAQQCYDDALKIAIQIGEPFLILYTSLAKARLARLTDNLTLSEKILQMLLSGHDLPSKYEQGLLLSEYGCYLLYAGRYENSISELLKAVSLFEQDGRIIETCLSKLWLAAALAAVDEKEECLTILVSISEIIIGLKEVGPLYINVQQAYRWLEPVMRSEVAPPVVELIFSRAAQFQIHLPGLRRKIRQIAQNIAISPPHLDIRTLGLAKVIRSGKTVTHSEWQTRETRDLFFFLLHSGPLTKEEISSVFWPDISPARLKMRFKSTMYRLRHAVGQDAVIFKDEKYQFNRTTDYEYDLETFQELIQEAESLQDDAGKIKLLQAAVDLVRGPYLEDIDAEWVVSERARLESAYQFALLRLADMYLSAGQASKSLDVTRTALSSYPLLEEAHRLSMRAFAAMRDRASVVQQYEKCRDLLDRELQVKPSKETENLYRQLTR
jgi:LuxR family maltose regulon positive regulatory protein